MRYVLFVCNHNAGRSQMAQAFFERDAPGRRARRVRRLAARARDLADGRRGDGARSGSTSLGAGPRS